MIGCHLWAGLRLASSGTGKSIMQAPLQCKDNSSPPMSSLQAKMSIAPGVRRLMHGFRTFFQVFFFYLFFSEHLYNQSPMQLFAFLPCNFK